MAAGATATAGEFRVTPARAAIVALFLVAATLVALLVHRAQGFIVDDAFIHFRYARNLADGHGWTYNVGVETADAATSTLYPMVLAVAYRLHADMLVDAKVIFAISIAATATLVFMTLRALGEWIAGVAGGALLVASPWLLATLGMETALFLALTAACLSGFVARRGLLTGVLLAVLFAVRADGVLLAAVLVVAWQIRDRKTPWRLLVGGLATGVSWLLVAYLVTGNLFADTLSAKAAQGKSGYWGTGWVFLRGFQELPSMFLFRGWFLALCGLAVIGAVCVAFSRRLWCYVVPLVAFTSLHLLFYGVIFNVPGYHWYYALEVFTLSVLGGIGIGDLARRLLARRALGAAVVIPALVLVLVVGLGVHQQPRGNAVVHYQAVADWLLEHTQPGESVASTEIGSIGWETNREMIDYVGLLSGYSVNEVARSDFVSWLRRERPDYWLVHAPPWSFEAPALASPYFDENYVSYGDLRVDSRTGEQIDYTVYKRKP